jgi:hypothetical protein
MLENVLTHPSSRLTSIDVFVSSATYKRYLANIRKSGQAHRITTITGYSQIELMKLPRRSFDIIYIDGSHTADDVLADAVLSWELLKTGGLIIFDDYGWNGSFFAGSSARLPYELRPALAIYAFMQCYRYRFKVVHFGYQVILKKRPNPCPDKFYCTPVGRYLYNWKEKRLVRQRDNNVVPLSRAEKALVEDVLMQRRFIGTGYQLKKPVNPKVQTLFRRLGLKL